MTPQTLALWLFFALTAVAVITWTRNQFGNSAPPLSAETAAAIREAHAGIEAPAGSKRTGIERLMAAR